MSVSKKRLIITENDREYIKRLYGIVSEQNYGFNPQALEPKGITPPESFKTTISPKRIGGFSERVLFRAGYHSGAYMNSKNLQEKLNNLIKEVYPSKLSEGPYILNITTEASESQIPNTDNEKNNAKLERGELADMRNETIKNFIRTFIKTNYPELKPPIFDIKITNKEPLVGSTKWVGSFFCPEGSDPRNTCVPKYIAGINAGNPKFLEIKKKYDSEQYNGLEVELIKAGSESETKIPKSMTSKENCSRGLKIKVFYEKGGNHKCNSSVYEVYVNDVLMNRDRDGAPYISLNNKGLMDNSGFTLGSAEIPISPNSNKKVKKFMVISDDEGGSREDAITVTDDKLGSFKNSKGNINIKFVCRNLNRYIKSPEDLTKMVGIKDVSLWQKYKYSGQEYYGGTDYYFDGNEWISRWWGDGCHESVGKIEITNTLGKKLELTLRTPTQKNGATFYNDIDPCSLTMERSLLDKGETINVKPLQY